MERNTKKGYAYWAYLLPPRLVPLKFFQDFADGTSSDYRYMIYPTMSFATQPSLPMKLSLRHDAFAKVRNKLEIKKEKGKKFENNVYFNLIISLHLVVGFLDLKSCLIALVNTSARPLPLGRVYCWAPITMVSEP